MLVQLAARYMHDLDATMRQIIDSLAYLPADFTLMLRYTMGWVDEHGSMYNQPTGKRIRPLLLLLCAEAAGGSWRDALPAAAAVEFLHNFSLIHDDIEDDSLTRHGRPTVWNIWGTANAINAGDALFTVAFHALQTLNQTGIAPDCLLTTWGIFNRTAIELTRGQHLDMRFEHQSTVSVEDYLSMITGKSAALVAACAHIGALIGGNNTSVADNLASFGLNLGIAFQIRDDILGIWGDPGVTGKSAATDILSRKKSLPVLHALSQNADLSHIYAREHLGEADVSEALKILEQTNAQSYTEMYERQYYEQALTALKQSALQGEAGLWLADLAESLFQRTH
ncbi:MAG: polyprenyl synthetase family protein [Anaerolineae bacterium]|nr:polyprenyl synthetase family protein [Anaerolineae bacterium]